MGAALQQPAVPLTREQWFNAIAQALAPRFAELGKPLPEKLRLSYSLMGRAKAVGVCFFPSNSADSTTEIFVRTDRDDSVEVAAIIAHELAHAALGFEAGHKAPFKRLVYALGLEGKATATAPGPEFKALVAPILERLGPVPHAALDPTHHSGPKKQGTRMIKVACSECGFTVRMTQKWIDEVGAAHCPAHGEMRVEGDPDGEGE